MVRPRYLPLAGAVFVVVAALSGCGGGGSSDSGGSTASSAGSSSGTPIKTISITETEYKLSPSAVTVDKAGTYEFKAANNGSVTHALEVEGNGVEEETGDIAPGESKTLKVTFKKTGSFEIYCPVDGHRAQGMEGTVTVGSAGAAPGGTTTNEDTMRGDTNETETGDTTTTKGGGSGY
jgi:plastocyanin